MGYINWKEEYSVGVREMDKQHKKIIKILNQSIELQKKGKNEKIVENILNKLYDYIKEHFRAEEEYIIKHQCDCYDQQKKEHHIFIDRLFEFQKEYLKTGHLTEINLFNFIWDWFSKHIMESDKQYSPSRK